MPTQTKLLGTTPSRKPVSRRYGWPRMATLFVGLGLTVLAQAADNNVCKLGARIVDRQDRHGTVVQANGPDCHVKLDDGTKRYYLAWMLEAEGSAKSKAGSPASTGKDAPAGSDNALTKGRYVCWAAGGVAGKIDMEIRSASSYSGNGKSGDYVYDAATKNITFTSGPWGGFYGRRLSATKIGISSRKGGSTNTSCDLK